MIISASRRSDIPAYYSEWFLNRLKAGYVLTRNPMNHAQISKIELSPQVIDGIVFWSKDPLNLMDQLPLIDLMGYRYYFQFTLTPYDRELEPYVRNKQDLIKTFGKLSEMLGKDRVLWRYDPIIMNHKITPDYHKKMFEQFCRQLRTFTNICTISFVDKYTKLSKARVGNLIRELTLPEMYQMAAAFSEIAGCYGIELRACCEQVDLSEYGIIPASCIDQQTIEKVCGYKINVKRDTNQRIGCGCIQSIDIGAYNTCKHGCIYCYANYSDSSIHNNCRKHDPYSDILIGSIEAGEIIIPRKMVLLKKDQ
ncbi:MAG: hypothetical protein K0S76_783 [Herbinix sp.]|nr:hypothetical protein [Herbinix sp.]